MPPFALAWLMASLFADSTSVAVASAAAATIAALISGTTGWMIARQQHATTREVTANVDAVQTAYDVIKDALVQARLDQDRLRADCERDVGRLSERIEGLESSLRECVGVRRQQADRIRELETAARGL